MGFQYVDYDTLSKYIRESIATELKSHKLDARNLPKALRTLSVRHPDRAIQCRYLLAVLNSLDKSISPEKTCILNAAAFYIREQIFDSYQGTVTSFFLSPENSTLYNALTTSLNLTLENFPDSKNLLDMYDALSKFMHGHVYVDSDPSKGYLDLSKQLFSSQKIKNYKVEKVLKDLVKKVADFKLEQIEQTQLKESDKKTKNRIGLFSDKIVSTPPSEVVVEQGSANTSP
ncbi:hypothetical protein [Legionella parisiensis]|uniref:Dot/Icm T4SS effector n=1 Tax=Legionella parisiensis TaxID=45071 RepID=A0A1E5JMJ1_9GAMM|nr:hypothetical protein [Legionella parisiensis]KTD41732.1 Dot/Icm T4SS effector [Legionella parisiensis]OEH45749.1 hypothetical protein lpari_03262 [Legionella parisiensis]STX75946.1 Dot/Icm T4SS effector [Legionella parisiensis]